MSFARLRECVWHYVADDRQYRTQTIIDKDDTYLLTLANDNLFLIVSVGTAPMPSSHLIDVHAGGAYGVAVNNQVLEILVTSSWRFDFGGLWCRLSSPQLSTPIPGTLNFGWRSRLPSQLFSEGNLTEAFGYLSGSVRLIAGAAGALAHEVSRYGGGQLIRDHDPGAWPALVGGLVPPVPSD